MEYLVTGKEMQAYDTYTIEHIGIPAPVLMERAALETVRCIQEALLNRKGQKGTGRVLCVCGTGNNGGDGLCVARLLADLGLDVDAVLIGNIQKAGRETKLQLSILEKYGIYPSFEIPDNTYDVIVDALFGTGLSREVTGAYKEAIDVINARKAYRISIDMPSGIDADTGAVLGTAVKAEETVTLAFRKRGLYLYPGCVYAGKIRLADIGITRRSICGTPPGMYTKLTGAGDAFPQRKPDGNKGTFGKLLLVAGSESMAGAAVLAGYSAYKAGAGMVKLVIPEKIREIVQKKLPEALIQTYESPERLSQEEEDKFLDNLEWAQTAAIGPGLSVCESARRFVRLVIAQKSKPLVMDADALNILAMDGEIQKLLKQRNKGAESNVILTPHMGELARLLGVRTEEVVADEPGSVREAAKRTGCIVAGKSARTYVCEADGSMFLNTAGNSKMATAGSGDVLTGIIAALLAQGMPPRMAAENGVFLHACAGDAAAGQAGPAGLTASEIVEGLKLL